jgi:membrane protein implicated in regulation of membrane protease activity
VEPWVAWLVAAAVLAGLEVLTLTLVLGLVAGAAVLAAAVAIAGGDVAWQVATFALASAGLLVFVRPIARHHLVSQPPAIRTGVAALVGNPAVVIERVDAHGGRVKLAGELWSARSYDPMQVLEPGTPVDVIEIEGATALVYGQES